MGKIQEAIDKARDRYRSTEVGDQAMFADRLDNVFQESTRIEGSAAWPAQEADLIENDLLEKRVIAGLEHDERVTPYRQLRTHVLKLMRDHGWKSLAITSPHELAGTTLTAMNLAISISRNVNHDIVLVDLDLRTPSIHNKFGFEVEIGVSDYLKGHADLRSILVNPGLKRLFVLPGKPIDTFASEMLASPSMKQMMKELKGDDSDDRIVVFDLPPLLRNDDALIVTPMADATILVIEDGVTTESQLERSLHMLKGANLIGTVLNKAGF